MCIWVCVCVCVYVCVWRWNNTQQHPSTSALISTVSTPLLAPRPATNYIQILVPVRFHLAWRFVIGLPDACQTMMMPMTNTRTRLWARRERILRTIRRPHRCGALEDDADAVVSQMMVFFWSSTGGGWTPWAHACKYTTRECSLSWKALPCRVNIFLCVSLDERFNEGCGPWVLRPWQR